MLGSFSIFASIRQYVAAREAVPSVVFALILNLRLVETLVETHCHIRVWRMLPLQISPFFWILKL
jgi:hypothetical protein